MGFEHGKGRETIVSRVGKQRAKRVLETEVSKEEQSDDVRFPLCQSETLVKDGWGHPIKKIKYPFWDILFSTGW
jgi:hypothetical protein